MSGGDVLVVVCRLRVSGNSAIRVGGYFSVPRMAPVAVCSPDGTERPRMTAP